MDDLTDEMMLDMTRRRLRNLVKHNKSLRHLAAKTIINNHDYFFHEEDQRAKISCLPLTLRKKLLHLLDENPFYPSYTIEGEFGEFDARLKALQVLLPGMKNIKISRLMSFCHYDDRAKRVTEVMQTIAAKSPRVQSLNLNLECDSHAADEAFLAELGKMKNLKILQIWNCSFDFPDLKMLCREKLRLLEYIDVTVIFRGGYEFEKERSEDLQECFPNMKYFLYDLKKVFFYWPHNKMFDHKKFRSNLSEGLPNLKSCYNHSTLCFDHNQTISLPPIASDKPIRDLCVVVTDNLNATDEEDIYDRFRNRAENAMQGLPLVDSLNFVCALSERVFSTLVSHFGATIHTLHLHDEVHWQFRSNYRFYCNNLKFSSILSSCPSLESLSLHNISIAIESEPIKSFARLKRLKWIMNWKNVCLSDILAAPELENLCLSVECAPKDIDLINQQIIRGEILGKITTLQIRFSVRTSEGLEILNEGRDNIKKVCHFIKVASAFLPNLARIDDKFLDVAYNIDRGIEVLCKNYTGSHYGNLIDVRSAACFEALGEKTLCHILGEYNRRFYSLPSVRRH